MMQKRLLTTSLPLLLGRPSAFTLNSAVYVRDFCLQNGLLLVVFVYSF